LFKYLLVCLVKHPNVDSHDSISFFSWFVFDEFIAKGGEYGHKVDRTLANRVDERRNMINDKVGRTLANRVAERINIINNYLRGRDCIESVRGN
jgi:hypothetical protein